MSKFTELEVDNYYKNGFVFCSNRKCEKQECARHNVNLNGVYNTVYYRNSFEEKNGECKGFTLLYDDEIKTVEAIEEKQEKKKRKKKG